MYPEAGDATGRVRQLHLGEHLVVADPRRGQSTKRRAVAVPELGKPLVAVSGVHRDRARRRPYRQVRGRVDRAGAQRPFRVAQPRGRGFRPGKDRDTTLAGSVRLVQGTHHHLHRNRSRIGQRQRRLQRQLVDHRAAHFVARADRQLHQTRAWKDHQPRHGVIAQPALQGGRQPTRQHNSARCGHVDYCAQQRVRTGRLPQPGHIGCDAAT